MADAPLVKKLRLRPNQRALILNPPDGYLARLQPLPEGCVLHTSPEGSIYDFVQIFATTSGDLTPLFPALFARFAPDAIFWACYPKVSSGVETDLTRDIGWQVIYQAGYGGIASISIDGVWSDVRFRPQPSAEEWLADQYAGKKAALRPIFDRLLAIVSGLVDDVELNIRKNYVAFHRGKQFALVNASTASRVDVGVKLSDPPVSLRLEDAATFGSGSSTHKVALTSVEEVDAELQSWLAAAYAGAG
jgi:predicted transport protein